jgi:hypothetical protein
VNDRKKNRVNITSYDPVTKTVKGTFNLYFNGDETGDYPLTTQDQKISNPKTGKAFSDFFIVTAKWFCKMIGFHQFR